MITKEQITDLVTEALSESDRFVVDVTISTSNVISVFIDADSSVTIDHCVEVSRCIEDHLDRDVEDYELSVSSAGIDYPLLKPRQYKKYIDKDLVITDNENVKKNYKLVSCTENELTVQEAVTKKYGRLLKTVYSDPIVLELSQIKEIKPYINF